MRNKRLLIIFGILLTLTLIVAIGSAVFSIRLVDAYCYNSDEEELNKLVLNQKDRLMGKSIFALNEAELIESIEKEVGGIEIINVERLFPNRVSINYVQLYDYFEVHYEDKFYVSAIDGKFNRVDTVSGGDKVIELKIKLDKPPVIGGQLTGAEHFDSLLSMIEMLERLDFRDTDATAIIDFIDLEVSDSNIYVQTRSGVLIKLMNFDNAGEKLRKALSLYNSKDEYRRSGMIVVTNSDVFTYSSVADKIYEERNQ